ncbi:MAG: hypothetical protein KatS3mg115_1910 [Candidatus Poribacteria bacterium]|nr:MAG: hypothetical protein KatS3mg115_1910 [Candidatus Poribacteria bacterium]
MVCLMFFGGCAGSTGGGMKHVRILLIIKHGYAEIRRAILPRSVITLRIGEQVVPPEVMRNILGFFSLFIGAFAVGSLLLAALGVDLLTSVTASISALGNIGPGLGTVGAHRQLRSSAPSCQGDPFPPDAHRAA